MVLRSSARAGHFAQLRGHWAYLARHLRLDITMHQPAIARSLTAAGLPGSKLTAAAWCRALAGFPGGEAGFRDWLLRDALVDTLRLPAVADFHPGLLERARERLSRRPRIMAVWEDWLAGRGDFRDLLAANSKDGAAVRAEIHAARQAGIDPDLPPPFLHRLAMVSSLWGFSAAEARRYSEALAVLDMRALGELLRRSRKFVESNRRDFSRAVARALHPAPVPVISLRDAGRRPDGGGAAARRSTSDRPVGIAAPG